MRHGRGWQEAGKPYVRCEERECQYVDINQPPCPLHVDMFRDGSDELVGDYLATFAGTFVCYACIGDGVRLPHGHVRDAVGRLVDRVQPQRAEVRHARCGRCRLPRRAVKVTAALGTPPESMTSQGAPSDEIRDSIRALLAMPDVALCKSCFAFVTNRPFADAQRLAELLEHDGRFVTSRAECSKCRRMQYVIKARGAAATDL